MKYYISDLHLGHEKALEFDNRPFSTLAEMTEAVVSNWNSVVKKCDEVYILGDMFWSNDLALEVLPRLNGKLYLIKGNHDRLTAPIEKYFVWVKSLVEIVDEGRHIVLCHYPLAHWRNSDYGAIHLYGHIHASRDTRPFNEYIELMRQRSLPYECYNVGCMLPYMNYTPRTLDEIISGAVSICTQKPTPVCANDADSDICIWTKRIGSCNYTASCGEDLVPLMRGYNFCPYCGRKLEVIYK